MPVYVFTCQTCGRKFEQWLSFKEDPGKITCPQGHATVRRVYSAPAVVYKGSGFYVTDHRARGKSAG